MIIKIAGFATAVTVAFLIVSSIILSVAANLATH